MVEAVETPKEKRENLSLAEKLNRAIADIGPVKKTVVIIIKTTGFKVKQRLKQL